MDNLYIFTRGIRSGKTTELKEWIKGKDNIVGILMPDVNRKRTIYDIGSGTTHDLECSEQKVNRISVGRFHFNDEAFQAGRDIILSSVTKEPAWMVIDEVGKLEVEQGRGFEPAISETIKYYKDGKTRGNLLLVIRDTLLHQAKELYKLDDAIVVNNLSSLT